jgi:transcriptional regulator with XRE-family HTH domain
MEALLEAGRGRRATTSGRAAQIRVLAGVTQAEVARELGVTPACVSRWENNSRRPHGELAARYGRLLAALALEIAHEDAGPRDPVPEPGP